MRILHLADLHLDRPFPTLPAEAEARRRAELRSALRRCLALAVQRGVDAVTIGGDLWEAAHVTPETRAFVARELAALSPLPLLLVRGNHDAERASADRHGWPSNVHVFEGPAPAPVALQDVVVWGVSWTSATLDLAFLDSFRVPSDGRRHVLLVHAAPRGLPQLLAGRGAWGAVDGRAVLRCGFAICLAGHLHDALRIGPLVYPGSPEPLGWAGRGRHGCVIVDFDGTSPRVEWVPTAESRHVAATVDASGATSTSELRRRIAVALPAGDPRAYVRLHVTGVDASPSDVHEWARPHRGRFAALVLRVRRRGAERVHDVAPAAAVR